MTHRTQVAGEGHLFFWCGDIWDEIRRSWLVVPWNTVFKRSISSVIFLDATNLVG